MKVSNLNPRFSSSLPKRNRGYAQKRGTIEEQANGAERTRGLLMIAPPPVKVAGNCTNSAKNFATLERADTDMFVVATVWPESFTTLI